MGISAPLEVFCFAAFLSSITLKGYNGADCMADSIEFLLRKITDGVEVIRGHYQRDLAAQQVSDEVLYAVRGVIQDCQSALDWTATAVKAKCGSVKSTWKPYFPLAGSPSEFPDELRKQLGELATTHQAVAAAIERHQPFQPGHAELGYLHALAKVNKHSDFTPQRRQETPRWTQQAGGGSVSWGPGVSWTPGAVFVGGRPMGDPATTSLTIYVDWLFVSPAVSVLSTLQALSELVPEAVRDIRLEAGL
jgi:hypothetical protein